LLPRSDELVSGLCPPTDLERPEDALKSGPISPRTTGYTHIKWV
jgi:hypothetical protein